jgi:hypothetical protein
MTVGKGDPISFVVIVEVNSALEFDISYLAIKICFIEFATVLTAWAFERKVTIVNVVFSLHGEGRVVARAVIIVLLAI